MSVYSRLQMFTDVTVGTHGRLSVGNWQGKDIKLRNC
jgi:hypothetical protein